MKNTIRTISLAVLTLSGADADAHLKKCSLCKVGENKAGASGAVCTVDEFTVNKDCQDCLLAGEKPTEKTWCKKWAEPVKACADCVATEGSTWCWAGGMSEEPICAKKGVTNTCNVNADGQNVPAVTAKASCPVVPIPKMYSWEKDGGGAQCETCVNKPKTTTTTAPNANCAACDFNSGKTWCWAGGMSGDPICANSGVTNTCNVDADGQNVPAVTAKAGCPMVTTNTTTTPYLWCADQSCKTSCTGTSIDKANKAKCTAKTSVSKPYKYCAATKKCGHDTATTTFACTGDVVDASNFLTKCPRATGSKIATGATKETCGKTNTYSNGKWEAAKKCTSIESELLPQTTDDCAAFGKGLTGCCARKAPKKNGTKASSGSMVHLSVGAGIGAGIVALVAGLV